MAKTTTFRLAEDKTVRSGKFPEGEFIVYQGDEANHPILFVLLEVDGFYVLEGRDGKFLRPVATVDRDFSLLWAVEDVVDA